MSTTETKLPPVKPRAGLWGQFQRLIALGRVPANELMWCTDSKRLYLGATCINPTDTVALADTVAGVQSYTEALADRCDALEEVNASTRLTELELLPARISVVEQSRHTHANKSTLDGLSIVDGSLALNGAAIGGARTRGLFAGALSGPPTRVTSGLTTWINQGTAYAIESTAGLSVVSPINAGNMHFFVKPAPAPTYSVVALISHFSLGTDSHNTFFGWRNASTGALQFFSLEAGGTGVVNCSNENTWASTPYSQSVRSDKTLFVRLRDDGATISYAISIDGAVFTTIFSQSKSAAYLGANGYNQIIFGSQGRAAQTVATLHSYTETLEYAPYTIASSGMTALTIPTNATVTNTSAGVLFYNPASASNTALVFGKPKSGAFTVTAKIRYDTPLGASPGFGLGMRASSTTAVVLMQCNSQASAKSLQGSYYSTTNQWAAGLFNAALAADMLWMRLVSDGSTLSFSYSYDGVTFTAAFTRAAASFDQLAFFSYNQTAACTALVFDVVET